MICYVITGETASGKSSFALRLANKIRGEIINADSQQVIKELPILTDQPTDLMHHHLYGYKTCEEEYSSHIWLSDCLQKIEELGDRIPIIVGGSGFYIRALVEGLPAIPATNMQPKESREEMYELVKKHDPEINPQDIYRVTRSYGLIRETGYGMGWWLKQKAEKPGLEFKTILIQGTNIKEKIKARLDNIFDRAIGEVRANLHLKKLRRIIGFSEIEGYLMGEYNAERAKELIYYRTCQYAKRQRTWFRNKGSFDYILTTENEKNGFIDSLKLL